MNLPQLNLPPIDARLKTTAEGPIIFDRIRRKYVSLTPEEWVRQHFIHLLIDRLGYPTGLFKVERQHTYFGRLQRSDILVLDTDARPYLLVECKAPEVPINQKTLDQLAIYNKTLRAPYMASSNGLKHFVWKRNGEAYEALHHFPPFR